MGTGGALKFCEDLLDERFLMLNGDVLTDIDLTAQIAQHEATGATGTLGARAASPDPSNYGLVRTDDDGAVLEFIEKPRGGRRRQHDLGGRVRARALGARSARAGRARLDRA